MSAPALAAGLVSGDRDGSLLPPHLGDEAFHSLAELRSRADFLKRAIARSQAKPKHLVTDKGPQSWCQDFKLWCGRKDILVRFGAIGQHGSIAVIERLILTRKQTLGWSVTLKWMARRRS